MNWGLVGWFAGTIATLIGIKFIWTLFRTLFSKESMVKVIDSVGSGATNAANKMTASVTQKIRDKKERKKDENKPVVVNR